MLINFKQVEYTSRDSRLHKVMFVLVSFLLVISFTFFSITYAGYVSRVGTEGSANVAPIVCSIDIQEDLAGNTFVNAPLFQSVSDTAEAVQMNQFSDTHIYVSNNAENTGLIYEHGFMLYYPKAFAESAMFQLLRVGDNNEVIAASDLYELDKTSVKKDDVITHTVNYDEHGVAYLAKSSLMGLSGSAGNVEDTGVPVSRVNAYKSFLGTANEITFDNARANLYGTVSTMQSYSLAAHVLAVGAEETAFNEQVAGQVLCLLNATRSENLDIVQISLPLGRAGSEDYLLADGESAHYILRMVLRNSMTIKSVTDYSEFDSITSPDNDYEILIQDGKLLIGSVAPGEQEVTYTEVSVSVLGLNIPSKINGVFTQRRGNRY